MRLMPAETPLLRPMCVLIAMAVTALPVPIGCAADSTDSPRPAQDEPAGRFWPSDKLVDGLLRRWAAAAGDIYDLTADQRRALEAQVLERWPKFLDENREELEPLLNEYLEARLAGGLASAEAAQAWAGRVLGQLEKLRACAREGNEEIAGLLNDRQRVKFAADRRRFADEFEAWRTRLESWSRGQYDAQQWSEMTRPAPAEGYVPDEASQAQPDPADELRLEMESWDRFVQAFIARYGLDAGQRKAAESILAEMKARARDHYQRNRLRIAALEELIRRPRLATTRREVEAELTVLYGPIDAMFSELEHRLSRLPTRAQREAAEQKRPGT